MAAMCHPWLHQEDKRALYDYKAICEQEGRYNHGRPQKFFQRGGAKPSILQKVDTVNARRTMADLLYGAPKAQMKALTFLRRFRLGYRVYVANLYRLHE